MTTPGEGNDIGDRLDGLSRQLPTQARTRPPLHLWQPDCCGDIDIVIHRDGRWSHEGQPIRRAALVRLFASILRREADGEYYLVTPVEKWRIQVEGLPLLIVDFDLVDNNGGELTVQTNTGEHYRVGRQYPLVFPDVADSQEPGVPAVALDHGVCALFNRSAWYRLVEASVERDGVAGVLSGGVFFPLQPA